ncbi:uncharacterized protein LOC129601024 [Paramacrobiotus metropolitanus]|uniref:uncharacterized protein LOC129601024 n=1 Tax=Paramacrobiotus metropolitanus TaxID=2943436 RepID=UPI00244560B9|nr:uncharacterized protein LOC129601024 [Paramacrobiotus metropolitanus]
MAHDAAKPSPRFAFQIVELIDFSGTQSRTYLAHRTNGVHPVEIVAKKVHLDLYKDIAQAQAEALDVRLRKILTLEHPNLVRHLAYYGPRKINHVDVPHYMILMEYCTGGNLHAAAAFHIAASLIQTWTRQIVDGLLYLHAQNIVHGEISSSHILLSSPDWNNCRMKIAHLDTTERPQRDWSAPKDTDECRYAFRSPEKIQGGDTGRKSDIWSFGCVVLEMASGSLRFVKEVKGHQHYLKSDLEVMYYIGSGGSPEIPQELPDELRAFVAYCQKRDPVLRPLAAELLYTDFLTLANISQWSDPRPQRS